MLFRSPIRFQLLIEGNTHVVDVITCNAAGELTKLGNRFTGDFFYSDIYEAIHGKGGALGYLDKVLPNWEARVKFLDLGYVQRLKFASSNGQIITLAQTDVLDSQLDSLPPGVPGIGDSLRNNTFVFRSSGPGCFMPASQVAWYLRGLRIESCCSIIIEYMGGYWAIIKRSIGPDDACGGGESENTECIKSFLRTRGHPSIAWPVIMPSREGIGTPTSGFIEFVEDKILEQDFFTIMRAASAGVIYSHGDVNEHEVIIFPRIP